MTNLQLFLKEHFRHMAHLNMRVPGSDLLMFWEESEYYDGRPEKNNSLFDFKRELLETGDVEHIDTNCSSIGSFKYKLK